MNMHPMPRRDFLELSAKLATAAAVAPMIAYSPARAVNSASQKTIGIQIGAVSFVDEGTDQVTDRMNRAVVCTFFWWQEGQNHRLLHEKASRYSCSQ